MRTVHVLQHAAHEGPGRIAEVARERGFTIAEHRLFDGAALPAAIESGDALVVMGGSMGVGDIGDPRFPFLAAEVPLVQRALTEGRPVLGVCLGAQLMAHALGAHVYPLVVGDPPVRHREVGWGAVTWAESAGEEPVLAGLDASEVVLHWHGDTFDLPRGATLLASTLACENQMFRWGRSAFALQFHVEVASAHVASWTREDAAFVLAANGAGGARRIAADTARLGARARAAGDRLLRNLFDLWS